MIHRLFGIIAAIAFFHVSAHASPDEFKVLNEAILAIWKDSNNPLCVAVPSGQLIYQSGVKLVSPVDGRTYILTDEKDALAKTIFHCATGIAVTIHVSTIVPGLIVGMVDFEGDSVQVDFMGIQFKASGMRREALDGLAASWGLAVLSSRTVVHEPEGGSPEAQIFALYRKPTDG